MVPTFVRKFDTTLKTTDGTCAVAHGKEVIFKSKQKQQKGTWTCSIYRDEARMNQMVAFSFNKSYLILDNILDKEGECCLDKEGNMKVKVKLESFKEEEQPGKEGLFEWCNGSGQSGSLQSVANEKVYLAIEKIKKTKKLIAVERSDNPKAAVFEFPPNP